MHPPHYLKHTRKWLPMHTSCILTVMSTRTRRTEKKRNGERAPSNKTCRHMSCIFSPSLNMHQTLDLVKKRKSFCFNASPFVKMMEKKRKKNDKKRVFRRSTLPFARWLDADRFDAWGSCFFLFWLNAFTARWILSSLSASYMALVTHFQTSFYHTKRILCNSIESLHH